MTVWGSRLRFSLDPLIAEAKRRARLRRVIVVVLCVLLLGGVAGGLTLAFRPPRGGVASSRGSHTYVVTPKVGGGLAKGVYITVVSPVAIPYWGGGRSALTGSYPAYHVSGPQACAFAKHVHGLHGLSASLNGKTVTVTVNGSGAAVSRVCSEWKKMVFKPTSGN
jgi:hypothetical protein